MNNKLSTKMCAYREGHSTQHLLLKLIDRWRRCLDKSGVVGTILMDLSKAFDSLPHDLLIAKLDAYGFSEKAVELIFSYLNDRYQRVKVSRRSFLEITITNNQDCQLPTCSDPKIERAPAQGVLVHRTTETLIQRTAKETILACSNGASDTGRIWC